MNSSHKTWIFSLLAILMILPVLSLGEGQIEIDGADELWSAEVDAINDSANNLSGETGNEPLICHADEVWNGAAAAPDNMLLDITFGGDFDLSADLPLICHADEVLNHALKLDLGSNSNPKPDPETPKDAFVYVALGDSYQSGEGAGNSILNTQEYLTSAYEAGTYTDVLFTGGNSCHRSLENYAKINRDKLKPGAVVILIDQTCSGARIENSARSPIVGVMESDRIDPNSQIAQSIGQLKSRGLTAADVDLVTVGMGGNDANFTDIIYACVLPNILRRALDEYPNSPGEISGLVDKLGTCQNLDQIVFKSDQTINQLYSKEIWAQNKLLDTFSNARILQLNYPNILPQKEKSTALCSGIRKEDLNYANKKVKQINQRIKDAFNANSANNPRLEFIDMQDSLGDNAICPGNDDNALANPVNSDNLDAEIKRLLDLDGNGDHESRKKIDQLYVSYNDWKQCLKTHLNIFDDGADCNTNAAWENVKTNFEDYINYINNQKAVIFSNLVTVVNVNEDQNVRFDRSQGLFHPNAKAYEIAACNVLSAYNKIPADDCLPAPAPSYTVTCNGNQAGNFPFNVTPGEKINIKATGFVMGGFVTILKKSVPLVLATVNSDSNGNIDADIILPPATPGVHIIELRGEAASGAAISQEIRINYPGNPQGEDNYKTYLTGFTPNTENGEIIEEVKINYAGQSFGPFIPDEDGGILFEVPLLGQIGAVAIQAEIQTTGKIVENIIRIADTASPEILISSPEENHSYLNNVILPITYEINDNQSADENIIVKVFFDNGQIMEKSVDLSLQKTGEHNLVINVQDEAGNIAEKKLVFANTANIDSIIDNINRYHRLKLIKTKTARNVILIYAKTIKAQFGILEQIRQNKRLSEKNKTLIIKNMALSINRQINNLTGLIDRQSINAIDQKTAAILIDSLEYVKID